MPKEANNVRYILEQCGYQAVQPVDADEWKSLEEVSDHYGTTDDTRIRKPGAGEEYATLTDIESGERLAKVRENRPEATCSETTLSEGTTEGTINDLDRSEVNRLRSGIGLPNVQTAAYLLAMVAKEKLNSPNHEALVTSANLAVLVAWDDGLRLTDLDMLNFNLQQQEGESRLEIERHEQSVSVQVKPRSFSLEEPWNGMYSVATVAGE